MRPYLPQQIFNEVRVFCVFAEDPKVRYSEALRRSCMSKNTFEQALKRLVEKGVLEKVKRGRYRINRDKALIFLTYVGTRIEWDQPVTDEQKKIRREIEANSLEFPRDFDQFWKFETFEELIKWLDKLPFEWELGYVRRMFRASDFVPKLKNLFGFLHENRRRLLLQLEHRAYEWSNKHKMKYGYKGRPRKEGIEFERAAKIRSEEQTGRRIVKQACPECGSTEIIFDYESAEIVCPKCGVVIERIIQ